MRKILIVVLLAAVSFMSAASAEDQQKAAPAQAELFARIKEAKDCPEAFEACNRAIKECARYEDYEKLSQDLKDLIDRRKDYQCPPSIYYAVGKARVDELAYLAGKNDIESGRVYMAVNEKYYKEALEYLEMSEKSSKSKDLLLEIYLLKFIIFKETFQQEKLDAVFNDIVSTIASYTTDKAQNLAKLKEVSKKFADAGLDDYAMKLKFIYASKVDPESANMLADDIRGNADRFLESGDAKEALSTYDTYIQLADICYDKDTVAGKIMDIAEKYFEKKRYRDAGKYYSLYISRYKDSQVADYANYKLALSYAGEKDYPNAIARLTEFLKIYQNSVWFEKGFEELCRIYYETSDTDTAIGYLQKLAGEYPNRDSRDYAHLLTAILYYSKCDYDKSLEMLKNIQKEFPKTAYYNPVEALITDINDIKAGGTPSYSFGSQELYKIWDPYMSPTGSIGVKGAELVQNPDAKPGQTFVKAKPGANITFTVVGLDDLDKFSEFKQDKEDQSRLPKEIKTGTEKDLLLITWSVPDSGKFQDDKQSSSRTWQAPDVSGDYTITITPTDMALVRPPDSGSRKDKIAPLSIYVTVEK
jgi:tetratricopeptide (TPR) repeat protein